MGNRLSLKSSSSLRCMRLLYRLADLRAVKPRSQLQLTVSGSQRPQKLQLELLTTHSRIFKRKKNKALQGRHIHELRTQASLYFVTQHYR